MEGWCAALSLTLTPQRRDDAHRAVPACQRVFVTVSYAELRLLTVYYGADFWRNLILRQKFRFSKSRPKAPRRPAHRFRGRYFSPAEQFVPMLVIYTAFMPQTQEKD